MVLLFVVVVDVIVAAAVVVVAVVAAAVVASAVLEVFISRMILVSMLVRGYGLHLHSDRRNTHEISSSLVSFFLFALFFVRNCRCFWESSRLWP